MRIILNHTLRSIRGNKGQIAVIVLTITVVTAMIFAAFSLSDLFYNLNVSNQSRLASDNDITVEGEYFSVSRFSDFLAEYDSDIEKSEYFFQTGGLLETYSEAKIVMLEATDLTELWNKYPEKLKISSQCEGYEYPAVWIGKDIASELKLSAGDIIEVYLESFSRTEKFTVVCIMENTGFFSDNLVDNILIDISDVNNQGLASCANIKLKDSADFDAVSAALKEHMKNDALTVKAAIDYERAREVMQSNSDLLNIALVLIMAMMFLILYTSYLVIVKNRLNEMVIFKAAGASPFQAAAILLFEVILYGVVGAGIGLAISRLGMGFAVKAIIPNFPNAVSYQWWKYLAAFLIGVGVSAASAVAPIIRLSKKSIRELTGGAVKELRYAKPLYIVITTVLIIVGVVLMIVLDIDLVALTVVIILLFALWIAGVIPYVVGFISNLLGKFRPARFSSISIKRNSASHTLSVLVGSLITFSFFVLSVINLVVTAVTPYNARYDTDYVISGTATSGSQYEAVKSEISKIDGVAAVYHIRTSEFEFTSADGEEGTYDLVAIDSARALVYMTDGLTEKDLKAFETVQSPIVINNDLALRLGLKIGDKFNPSRIRYSARESYTQALDITFTVAAIEYSATENDRVAYIYADQYVYKGEKLAPDSQMLFVSKGERVSYERLFLSIRGTLESHKGIFTMKFEDWKYAATKGLDGVSVLFRILQIVVSAVASIGIINLSIVTLIDRRKEFSVYRSSGMSSGNYRVLTFFEGLIVGLSGCLIGIALSFLINRLMNPFAQLINKYMSFSLFPVEILIIAGIGLVVYTLLYWAIAAGNSKFLKRPITYNERM